MDMFLSQELLFTDKLLKGWMNAVKSGKVYKLQLIYAMEQATIATATNDFATSFLLQPVPVE